MNIATLLDAPRDTDELAIRSSESAMKAAVRIAQATAVRADRGRRLIDRTRRTMADLDHASRRGLVRVYEAENVMDGMAGGHPDWPLTGPTEPAP
jgi:hypothetical protein